MKPQWQNFCISGLAIWSSFVFVFQPRPHPFFKGKALGTRLFVLLMVEVFHVISQWSGANVPVVASRPPPRRDLFRLSLGILENYDEDNLVPTFSLLPVETTSFPGEPENEVADDEGNGNIKKSMDLVRQNNNSARASRFFVHFFAVPEQLQRLSLLENGNDQAIN